MIKLFLAGAIAAVAALSLTGVAEASTAHSASSCGGWYAWNLDGEAASVRNVTRSGMNCASSKYVVNRWLKKGYERQTRNRIPTHFYDGYVTWTCYKTSYYRWKCAEYESGTSFRFTAVYYG
jgi:hypothetical protein